MKKHILPALLLVVSALATLFFVWSTRHTKNHFEECRQHCAAMGAGWNWGHFGCECGGPFK